MSHKNIKSIIAISSCKGGVGKSTIAAHMALELASRGLKVGLLDADVYGPSVPTLFSLQDYRVKIDEFKQFIPATVHKLKVMSFGFLIRDAPAVIRGPIVTRYIQQLLLNTAWEELDYLFIDMPPGTGDVQLTITQTVQLNGAVIITTPQSLSLVDVARGIIMFEKVQVPILGVIENMSYFLCDKCEQKHYLFGHQGAQILKNKFGIEILAEVPIESHMIQTIDQYKNDPFIKSAADNLLTSINKISATQTQTPKVELEDKELVLIWSDGKRTAVGYRDLRLNCQCAMCVNEVTGKRMLQDKNIREDITPKEVFPLGNYALSIVWSDGHSSGIYPYEHIKKLSSQHELKR